ncbi:hypothetical protein [Aerococcus vaginalis]
MSETNDWRRDFLERAKQQANDYETIAYLEAAERLIQELDRRIKQAEGELDGMMWNHEEW